jgi:hypothetical protein
MQLGPGKDSGDVPDAGLPFLSVADAGLLRRLFREAMAERGRELVADGDWMPATSVTVVSRWCPCSRTPRRRP